MEVVAVEGTHNTPPARLRVSEQHFFTSKTNASGNTGIATGHIEVVGPSFFGEVGDIERLHIGKVGGGKLGIGEDLNLRHQTGVGVDIIPFSAGDLINAVPTHAGAVRTGAKVIDEFGLWEEGVIVLCIVLRDTGQEPVGCRLP